VDEGVDGLRNTQPGQPLYLLAGSGATSGVIESQHSVFMKLATPLTLPDNDSGVNEGPDFFVVPKPAQRFNIWTSSASIWQEPVLCSAQDRLMQPRV